MARLLAVPVLALAGAAASTLSDRGHDLPPLPTIHTTTRTVTHQAKVDGRNVHWWARRARHNGHLMRARGITLRRIRARLHDRWAPTVDYGLRLASAVFGVPYSKMRAVAWCESRLEPWATNGRYRGVFQLGWSPFGFSPFDPVASALSTAQTVVHDGSWRQWECG